MSAEPPAPADAEVLDLALGTSPLVAEHRRIVSRLLVRGNESPAIAAGTTLAGTHEPKVVALAAQAWRDRTRHEHHSAMVYSRLLPQLVEAGATLEHKTVILRAAMDELHHAALSADVVRLLGGDPRVPGSLRTEPLPEHTGTSARVRVLRNVLFSACLGETIGSALLGAEHELTTEPSIARVLGQLAADETLHARLGWALLEAMLPSLDARERGDLARYLPLALGTMEAELAARMPVRSGDAAETDLDAPLAALGVTTPARAREIVGDALREAILPALTTLGFDAAAAWRERRAGPLSFERAP